MTGDYRRVDDILIDEQMYKCTDLGELQFLPCDSAQDVTERGMAEFADAACAATN